MFREIRKSEKITEKSAKQRRIDYLCYQLADCLIGSERWYQIRAEINELDNDREVVNAYDPDKRI